MGWAIGSFAGAFRSLKGSYSDGSGLNLRLDSRGCFSDLAEIRRWMVVDGVVKWRAGRRLLRGSPGDADPIYQRVANFYFLVTGILSVTSLAPYSAESAIVPLIVVIGATMAKEGIEDWRRKQQWVVLSNASKRGVWEINAFEIVNFPIPKMFLGIGRNHVT
ncbi:hypothetical protein CASFOL_030675 [Castilleja foliolosa]|uniref:Uncharacterized protein n=1 Tax=Castilleja foliolosa TaxID=1961234 RepID=A0ABD3C605_9LAMI